ncbi:hypothetical protein RB201_18265 [Streptomyces sp. S1A(2023)]
MDEGGTALLLHTAMYAQLCKDLGGDFVHHFPGYDPMNHDPEILDRTRSPSRLTEQPLPLARQGLLRVIVCTSMELGWSICPK